MALIDVIGRLCAVLPEGVLRRIPLAPFRYSPSQIPASPPTSDRARRLLVAPVNFAGQGYHWAHAAADVLSDTFGINMAYVAGPDTFAFEADQRVPLPVYMWSRRWQRAQKKYVLENITHVLVEAQRPVFSGPFRSSLPREVRLMQQAGVQVAALCHGSDIRLPSRHARDFPESPFTRELLPELSRLEREVRRRAHVLDRMNVPTFVSTPDLLRDVPDATWLPVVVDAPAWKAPRAALAAGRKLVVAHAPSKAAVKGTDAIEPILHRLHDEGVIDYLPISGIKHADMPAAFAKADVVLDQFRLASYGVAACEAMAAGRLVVSHVSDEVRAHVHEVTGRELPIVQARIEELERVLREVASAPRRFAGIARRGVEFVDHVHSGTFSAQVLAPFLGA